MEVGGSVALMAAIVLVVVRYFQDRPTTKILKERIEALEGARVEDKAEVMRATEKSMKAEEKAQVAAEFVTQRARVEELHRFAEKATGDASLEHKQIIVALQSISEQNEQASHEAKAQTEVLKLIADRLSPRTARQPGQERRRGATA